VQNEIRRRAATRGIHRLAERKREKGREGREGGRDQNTYLVTGSGQLKESPIIYSRRH